MRKLMWFAIGFAAACGIGAYLDPGTWLIPLLLTALFCTVGMWYLMQWQKHCRIGIAVFLGLALGFGWFFVYDCLYLSGAKALDGKEAQAEIRVTDYSWETDYGTASDGEMVLDGKTYRVRFYLNENVTLLPGDRISGTFQFQTTTGGEKTTFHRGEGIFLLVYQKGSSEYTFAEYLVNQDLPTFLRYSLTNLIEQLFPADTSPFAKALLLGDDTDLDYETETALKISGIRHVVAVSGLHVSVLFTMICFLSGKKRIVTALVGIPVLILFAAVVGFTPSVTRACAMQCMMMLAAALKRDYDPPTALSFAALVMLDHHNFHQFPDVCVLHCRYSGVLCQNPGLPFGRRTARKGESVLPFGESGQVVCKLRQRIPGDLCPHDTSCGAVLRYGQCGEHSNQFTDTLGG